MSWQIRTRFQSKGRRRGTVLLIAALFTGANISGLPVQAQDTLSKGAPTTQGSRSAHIAFSPQRVILQGGVTQSDLIDLLERVGLKCAVHSDSGKLLIVDVHAGSDAFFQGVEAGDEIKTCKKQGERVTLICERNGKPYQVILQTLKAKADSARTMLSASAKQSQVDLVARNPSIPIIDVNQKSRPIVDVGPKPIPITDVGLSKVPIVDVNQNKIPIVDVNGQPKKPEDILKNYDVELIIDITGSMTEKDGTGDLTKFEWCRQQVSSFVTRMAKYNHGINITVFNTEFETHYNCTPGMVDAIYAEITPQGRTDLVDPLMARLNALRGKKGANGQPALIAVITDGLPNVPIDPLAVNRALIRYSQGLKDPNELLITFLQIGDTFDGRDFCIDLDDNLVNEGAKYDIVDTTTFADLKKIGMAAALVQALEEKKAVRKTPLDKKIRHGLLAKPTEGQVQAAAHDDAVLKERQDERKKLESELLGK